MNIRARLKRLEDKAPRPYRPTVWDVLAGAANPDELTGAQQSLWESFGPDMFTPVPITDPCEAALRELNERHPLPATNVSPAFPPGSASCPSGTAGTGEAGEKP